MLIFIYVVEVHPSDTVVGVAGDNIKFACTPVYQHYTIRGFQWSIDNLTVGSSAMFDNVQMEVVLGIGILSIYNLTLQYNGSIIQCTILTNELVLPSSEVVLLITKG